MYFIQTLWSCNSSDILSEKCRWLSPEYNLMSWALSSLQLRRFYPALTLYADGVSAKLLIDNLQLPYTEVVCNLDTLNCHPNLWALPKIHSYSIQDKPFLHVDGDVFIWRAFDENLLGQGIVTQNMETTTEYYGKMWKALNPYLSYMPDVMKYYDFGIHNNAYNMGIFGGNDIAFIKKYTEESFKFINKNNVNAIPNFNTYNFNVFFEQVLLFEIAVAEQKEISCLIHEDIGDNNYAGFGDFFEIPYNKTYLHILGNYKKNLTVCDQLASKLRQDYPEYYYKIIELYKTKKLPLFKDYYFFQTDSSKESLLQRYQKLKNHSVANCASANSEREGDVSAFLIQKDDNDLTEEQKQDFVNFRTKLKAVLNKFSHISEDDLYARDIGVMPSFENIFDDKDKVLEKIISKSPFFEIIKSKYRWVFYPYQILFVEDFEVEEITTAVVPECDKTGYSPIFTDEIDELILENLSQPITIGEFIEKIKSAFDEEDLKNSMKEFYTLIFGRIKKGLLHKLINCPNF